MWQPQPAREVEDQHRLAVHLEHLAQIGGAEGQRPRAGLVQDGYDRIQGKADLHPGSVDEEDRQASRPVGAPRVLEHVPHQRQQVLRADGFGEEGARSALQAGFGALLLLIFMRHET